jgi:ATP-binding cassette subfamily D (ALD) long-chain fatty acid import protein
MPAFSKPVDSISWFKQNKLVGSSLFAVILIGLYQTKQQFVQLTKEEAQKKDVSASFPIVDSAQKVGVNQEFRRQLTSIATILFPSWHTKEALLLILHSIFLVLRTYLSVVVARLDGRIVKDLVSSSCIMTYIFNINWLLNR